MVQVGEKVPFNKTNITRCMCPQCGVQAKSKCAKGKLQSLADALKKTPLAREDIPEVYCSSGKATCQDLDGGQNCICGSCAVFSQFNLGRGVPAGYFCMEGAAQ